MKRFRVLSDLHLDINREYPFSIGDKSVFTVIAGDVSGVASVVEVKNDIPFVTVKMESERKAIEFFRNRKSATVKFDSGKLSWTFNGKPVTLEESGIEIVCVENFEKSDISKNGLSIRISMKNAEDWIRKNVESGIMVAGNHLVYNKDGYSIEELKRRLSRKFPIDSNISFLDNSTGTMSKEVDGILFVGSTLYTDFKLPMEGMKGDDETHIVGINKRVASPRMSGGGMNDYVFGLTEEPMYKRTYHDDSELAYLTPDNYETFFNRTFKSISDIVEGNPDKEIVVVTHHCPSPKCISSEYVSSDMNASYVSDLEDFIKGHENIKCWVCGHVHHRSNFKVGNCLVVMNPLGYCKYGEYLSSKDGISHEWTPDTFVNTENWTVETVPFDLSKWNRTKNAYEREMGIWMKKYGSFFM